MSKKSDKKAWDRYAAAALQALLGRTTPRLQGMPESLPNIGYAVVTAAQAADKLLQERNTRFAPPDEALDHEVD